MLQNKLLLSLHDITPFHLERLRKAEKYFADWGITKILYLLIPNYHGIAPADHSAQAEFVEYCRSCRVFDIQWFLHGYYHLEMQNLDHTAKNNISSWFKRSFMTAGEGEFLALSSLSMQQKISEGKKVFANCLGYAPQGFVPPAWLHNEYLIPVLKEQGFQWTENHQLIFSVNTGKTWESPVITWATRSLLRKYGSLLVCPSLARYWKSAPLLRIAMHPFDFEHTETVRNIEKVIKYALQTRNQEIYTDFDKKTGENKI